MQRYDSCTNVHMIHKALKRREALAMWRESTKLLVADRFPDVRFRG